MTSSGPTTALLSPGDPEPVKVLRQDGASPFLLLGDHAGRAIPRRLGSLGLGAEAMDRHIAWDIGIDGLGVRLSAALDACFIAQTYSRLLVDCNRRPGEPGSIAAHSDGDDVPGNTGLGPADIQARMDAVYHPYQDRIAQLLDARDGRPTIIVALHSFTPAMSGFDRPWLYGVLHRSDSPFSFAVLAQLRAALGEAAGDNQPYSMDGTDNTVPLHADPRGLDYLELEVRQDLIADAAGQDEAAAFLAPILQGCLQGVKPG